MVDGTYRLSSPPRFIRRNLLDRALDFNKVHGLRLQFDRRLRQDGLHFSELVLVARDEVELFGRHCVVVLVIEPMQMKAEISFLVLRVRYGYRCIGKPIGIIEEKAFGGAILAISGDR
jgi:hypothetical protein